MRSDIRPLPSYEELHRLLAYDPETGILTWKYVRPRAYRIKVGGIAGTVSEKGYLAVGIKRKQYYAQRIIWKMMTGDDPPDQIDHKDGDRLNNRWENFRPASNGQNRWNTKLAKNNKSGIKGVHCVRGRWRAVLGAKGSQKHLGCFSTKEEAGEAWRIAAEKQRGEFFRAA